MVAAPSAGGSSIPHMGLLRGTYPLSWTERSHSHPKFLHPHSAGDRSSSSLPRAASPRMAGFGPWLC